MAKKPGPLLGARAIVLSAAAGRAGPPPPKAPRFIRLEYVRAPDAQNCPDAKLFRDALRHDHRLAPFDDSAAAQMRVAISRLGSRYLASIEVRDGARVWSGPKR